MKKRAALRRKSKNPLKKAKGEADRALQDFYRRKFPDDLCEVCGARAEVRHHHIQKSRSNFLRFNKDNLVALCHFCHSKIIFGDTTIVAKYSVERGKKWVEKMEKLKKIPQQAYSKKEFEEIIKKYSI